ncbi:MAG: hypothetical protein R3268_00395 [Acidiferrobacterales bacterium]|nr:hypothetical protein [Acidiferrobacterales bacterium]
MSDFEFLTVLVSVVLGFALTRLMGGLGHAYHFRRDSKMDAVHIAWTITTFFVIVLNWWVLLLWRDFEAWTFSVFLTVILWTTSMYVMVVALYPPRLPERINHRELYSSNRRWFMATFVVMCLLDLITTAIRDQGAPEPHYIAFVGHYAILVSVAVVLDKRSVDLIVAWYIAVTLIAWAIGVRGTLQLS